MPKDDVTADVSGIQLSNSTFSASPPGSLIRADNCVMPQKGVVEPRIGQRPRATLPTATSIPFSITDFEATTVANYGTSKQDTSFGLGREVAGVITAYSGGPYNPVDTDGASESAARMKFAQANQYLHFCTTTGPMTLETVSGTPRSSGLLRMTDPVALMASASNLPSTDGAGLEYGYSRAYRSVLRKPTSNGTSLLSPPSGRVVVQNRILAPIGAMVRTLGTTVTVTLPGTIDPGLDPGDTFTLDPGEADFAATAETVATVVNNVITYADGGANVANTLPQDLNTGPRPVAVAVLLTADATTSTPVRIYRSRDILGTDPDDEMFLIAELTPTAGQIAAGVISYLDIVPQSVVDDPLYTNPLTGEGAAQANLKPPIYRDVSNWGSQTWYANTTGFQQLRMQLLGVGTPDGIQNGDTITIAGVVFTFLNSPAVLTDIQITSNGTPSFNIQKTADSLIERASAKLKADAIDIRIYGESTQSGAPGKFLLEATAYDEPAFTVSASRVASWTPALSATSVAERMPHSVAPSKPGQPEAVPALSYVPVGSKSYPIRRILGLRQSLMVFKDGDGIWTVSGAFPYTVQQISTANIIAPDACCIFSDAAWVYTDEGVLRVSDAGGVTIISRPIETELQAQLGLLPEATYNYSFTVPYEQQRRVLMFVPYDFRTDAVGSNDLPVLRAWCYNNATQAWTGPLYDFAFSGHAYSTPSNGPALWLGTYDATAATTRITRENNGFIGTADAPLGYHDGSTAVTISEIDVGGDPLVIRITNMTGISAGDVIGQDEVSAGILKLSTIASVRDDLGYGYLELFSDVPFTASAAFVFKHYDAVAQFQPQGNPSMRKTLTRLAWLFKPGEFVSPNAETIISTDQTQGDVSIASPSVGFGLNPFGSVPFGDPSPLVLDVNPLQSKSTNAAQFSVGIRMPVCLSKMKLQGFTAHTEVVGAPDGRGK